MRFQLLGALEVRGADGTPVEIGAPMRRALLTALLLRPNRLVTTSQLVEALWDDDPPDASIESLQAQVSRLRKEIGPGSIETVPGGYRMVVAPGELDITEFEHAIEEARATASARAWEAAAGAFDAALALWRGPALVEVAERPFARAEAGRLEELRAAAAEERIEIDLERGRHEEVIPSLQAMVVERPLRERRWRQLMLALYRAGRQADALAAYRRLRSVLRTELGIDPSPEVEELQRRLLRQDPALAGLGHRQPTVHLPVPLTPLVGRRELLEAGVQLLRDVRLVSLVGAGGIGKTRLSLAIAEAHVPEQPGGVLFVDLAPIRHAAGVLPRIGELTGGGDRPGDVIGDAAMLLVLDNFEQVIDAAKAVAELLQRCRNLRVLVTTRTPLRVRGEHLLDVPPLPVDDARHLFVERATAVMAAAQLDRDVVDDIVTRLDGLPLAVELAAARTRVLAPALLRDRIGHRLSFLTEGARDAPDRHQTLRETIAWSYDLLSPETRATFRELSVFPGDFGLEAAAEVAHADVERMGELIDQSLVYRVHDRFGLLETIREFAAEAAVDEGAIEAAKDRHLDHYRLFPSRARDADVTGSRNRDWIAACTTERQNLRAALEWASECGDRASVSALFRGIGMYWLLVGAIDEGWYWGQRAVEATRDGDPGEHLTTLMIASEYPRFGGDLELALQLKHGGLALARRLGIGPGLAAILDDTAWVLAWLDRDDEATALLDEATAIHDAEEACEPLHRGHTLATHAEIAVRRGDIALAVRLVDEMNVLERDAQAWPDWTVESDNLRGLVWHRAGRDVEAREMFARAVIQGIDLGFRWLVADALDGLGGISLEANPERAARLIGMADRARAEGRSRSSRPAERAALVSALEGRLGSTQLERLRGEGQALTLQAIRSEALAGT